MLRSQALSTVLAAEGSLGAAAAAAAAAGAVGWRGIIIIRVVGFCGWMKSSAGEAGVSEPREVAVGIQHAKLEM